MGVKPLQIGITGGIGTGKSLVCKIFACLGVPIYDADSRAKSIMTTDGILIEQIKKEFGALAYDSDNKLNREYLSSVVFKDSSKLARLNELVHPRVGADSDRWVQEQEGHPYILREAALLFESGAYKKTDKVIVVTTPISLRVKRILDRDKQRSKEEIMRIIGNQTPEEEKISKADYLIINDEHELVIPQVVRLHELFTSLN